MWVNTNVLQITPGSEMRDCGSRTVKTVGLQVNSFYPFVSDVQVKMSAVFALGFTFITCVSGM